MKSFIILALFIFCFILGVTAQIYDFKITPLETTKSEVELLLGKSKDFCDCIYESEDIKIRINYSGDTCRGGWNIKKDVVIDFRITPKSVILTDKMGLKLNSLIKVVYDDFSFSLTELTNSKVYFVNNKNEVTEIREFPKPIKQKTERCIGFSNYNLVNEVYIPSYKVFIEDWEDSSFHLNNVASNFEGRKEQKLYVILYFSKNISKKSKMVWKKRIEHKLKNTLKKEDRNFIVINGGVRDKSEIVTFIIPETYPPPT